MDESAPSEAGADRPFSRAAIVVWATLGVAALLVQALIRLVPVALEPIRAASLSPLELSLYLLWLAFNAWAEGYRAFQLRFCPRVIARAFYLADNPRPISVTLAPLFAMGLFRARRARIITSWVVVVLITLAVIIVRHLPQPYRGIIDGGVVAGLSWGLVSLLLLLAQAFRGAVPNLPKELPSD